MFIPRWMLPTVLFTDIVDSTRTAADLGDARWRQVLEEHQRVVRPSLERFGGREVKSPGDGFLATFDGPASGRLTAPRDRRFAAPWHGDPSAERPFPSIGKEW